MCLYANWVTACTCVHSCICVFIHTRMHSVLRYIYYVLFSQCMYTRTLWMHPLVALLRPSPAVQSRGRGSLRWCEGASCGPRRSAGRGSVHCCWVPPSPPRTSAPGWLSCQCPCRWPPTWAGSVECLDCHTPRDRALVNSLHAKIIQSVNPLHSMPMQNWCFINPWVNGLHAKIIHSVNPLHQMPMQKWCFINPLHACVNTDGSVLTLYIRRYSSSVLMFLWTW